MRIIIESIPHKNDINSTIKPIDRKDANAEIEKGEIVFDPEKLTLHKALGKRHHSGGTPVNLNEGAFIFSDYNKLSLNKRDVEQMEFKEGGAYSKRKFTPAKILEREVDLKHHNKMVSILDKDARFIDDATLNAAQLMLQKNLEKVGRVAYKQEEKKQFRDGLPQFSQGTAPVYSDLTDIQIKQANQYKNGGNFLPKFQGLSSSFFSRLAGINAQNTTPQPVVNSLENLPPWFKFWTKSNTEAGRITPTGRISTYNPTEGNQIYDDYAYWRGVAGREFTDAKDYQSFVYNHIAQRDPLALATMQNYFGRTAKGLKNPDDPTYGFADGIFGARTAQVTGWRPKTLSTTSPESVSSSKTPTPSPEGNDPGNPKFTLQRTDYNLPFTDWQKINMAYPFLRAATVKTYMPLRQHQESVIARPELMSAQPYLNANNQNYFNASQLARIAPYASSVVQQLAGSRMDANNQAIGNVENQNAGILTGWRQNVAQTLNQDAAANRGFDRTYYDQVTGALQNRDDMRDYHFNTGITNVNSAIAQREAANQWMNSQDQIQTDEQIGTNPDGTPIFRTRAISELRPNFFGFNVSTPRNFDTRALLRYNTGLTNQQQDTYMQTIYDIALATIQDPNADPRTKVAAYRLFDGRNRANSLMAFNNRR